MPSYLHESLVLLFRRPIVLGPSGVPQITESHEAVRDPEFAVLSAVAHGHDDDIDMSVRIARAAYDAIADLDAERVVLYHRMIWNGLSQAAREQVQKMDPNLKHDERKYQQSIRAAMAAQVRTDVLLEMFAERYGQVDPEVRVRLLLARKQAYRATIKRLLNPASTLEEALEPLPPCPAALRDW